MQARKKEMTQEEINLIKEIGQIRKAKNITQRRLEELSGISQPNIVRFERAVISPSVGTVLRVLRPMGYTLRVVPFGTTSVEALIFILDFSS